MRFRDLGLSVGSLPTGQYNAITDVDGVLVGHETLIQGDAIRTGVTAIKPHGGNLFTDKVTAAVHTINGFGKACGFEQVRELGTLETPILLTNTINVGKVADAVVSYMIRDNPDLWSVNPLVGECNDSILNDIQGRHVQEQHVYSALESASSGMVTEGCVGAGTGTSCYGFKGGIGTASRMTEDGFTVGVLMQTNFGATHELQVLGVPVGQHITEDKSPPPVEGSVMVIIATDAPLTSRQLGRLSHRVSFGLGRTGTICHDGSGDFVVAFSTTGFADAQPDHQRNMNALFQAVVECVEESVYNALLQAETMQGFNGNVKQALPLETLKYWLKHYQRLS